MRLIDADAFAHEMFDYAAPEMMWDRGDILHKLYEMPEIIQCGHCIHFCPSEQYQKPFGECSRNKILCYEGWFCAAGERESDNE